MTTVKRKMENENLHPFVTLPIIRKLRADLHRSFQLIHHFQNLQLKITVDPVGSQKLARLIERLLALLPADERVEPGECEEDLPLALHLRQRFERGTEVRQSQ